MLARFVIILVLIGRLAESETGTSSVVTQDVQSKNISVGAPVVEFVCEVSEASSCNWIVNEEFSAQHVTVQNVLMIKNSLEKDPKYDVNDNAEIVCTMTVPTGPATLLNGTRVQCIPSVATGNFMSVDLTGTNTARMLLQGPYASVGDIHFSNESFAIEARWNRPYHLDGVPPTNYSCTVSTLSTEEELNTTVNYENASCSFMLEESKICDVLVIDVVAYNQWIGGDVERAFWSLGGSVRPSSIVSMVAYADGPYFTLSVEYEVVGVCLDLVQQVVVVATCSLWTGSNVWNVSNTSSIENGVILNATIGGVPEDQHCFFVISLSLATMESVNTTMHEFSTFDLKEVTVTPIDDQHDRNLCVTCTLREASDARGCLVSLQLHQGNETEPSNFTVGRDEHCLVQEPPGLYTVEVFDFHADGNLSVLPAYSQENLRIPHTPRPPTVTPEPTTTPPGGPTTASGLSTPGIVGVVIAGVAFLLLILVAIVGFSYLCCKYKRSHKRNVHLPPSNSMELRTAKSNETGKVNGVEEDGLPKAKTSPTKKPAGRKVEFDGSLEVDILETDPVASSTKEPERDGADKAVRINGADKAALMPSTEREPKRHPKISKKEVVFVAVIMILGLVLIGVVFYVVFAPMSQCEPANNTTLDGKSVRKRIQGSHEVIADQKPFEKQPQEDHLQECLQQSCHYGSPRVTIFYHESEQDKDELLSFVQGQYHQLPSHGCTENITQWTNVKPDRKPKNEV